MSYNSQNIYKPNPKPCLLPNNEEQVAKVEEALKEISYGKIWLFIPTLGWESDKEKNKKFIEDMADETLRKKKFLGIIHQSVVGALK